MYAFHNLKHHAKQRGIRFTLTVDELKTELNGSNYLGGSGREAHKLTIDRKERSKGYEAGNLQILTCSENARKRWVEDYA